MFSLHISYHARPLVARIYIVPPPDASHSAPTTHRHDGYLSMVLADPLKSSGISLRTKEAKDRTIKERRIHPNDNEYRFFWKCVNWDGAAWEIGALVVCQREKCVDEYTDRGTYIEGGRDMGHRVRMFP